MTGDWWFGLIAGFGVCLILWWVVDRHSPALAQPSPEAPRTARQKWLEWLLTPGGALSVAVVAAVRRSTGSYVCSAYPLN